MVTDERTNELHPPPQICNLNIFQLWFPRPQPCNKTSFTFRLWFQNQNSCGVMWRLCNCAQMIWKLANWMVILNWMSNCHTVWYHVKPIRFNVYSNITLVTFSRQNISWIAEWEYLIWKAEYRLTCLLCMPTTKYETIKTQTNLKHIIAWSILNVYVLMIDNIQKSKSHNVGLGSICS